VIQAGHADGRIEAPEQGPAFPQANGRSAFDGGAARIEQSQSAAAFFKKVHAMVRARPEGRVGQQ
jgi:hypothetical protein